jgi:hypothetical protein
MIPFHRRSAALRPRCDLALLVGGVLSATCSTIDWKLKCAIDVFPNDATPHPVRIRRK